MNDQMRLTVLHAVTLMIDRGAPDVRTWARDYVFDDSYSKAEQESVYQALNAVCDALGL